MFPQINGHFITSLPAPHEISPHQMRRFFNECVFLHHCLKLFGSRLTKIDFQMFNDLRFVENIDVSQNQVIFAKKNLLLNSSLLNLTLFLSSPRARARRACALRALGLLLADGAPTVGRLFDGSTKFFYGNC